jgi:hypothetical protein
LTFLRGFDVMPASQQEKFVLPRTKDSNPPKGSNMENVTAELEPGNQNRRARGGVALPLISSYPAKIDPYATPRARVADLVLLIVAVLAILFAIYTAPRSHADTKSAATRGASVAATVRQ